jgi:hypothetical protein
LKALPRSCWKFTCAWLMHCLSCTEPSLTSYHSRRLQVSGRTAKLDSVTNFCVPSLYINSCKLEWQTAGRCCVLSPTKGSELCSSSGCLAHIGHPYCDS